jgi:glycerol-3-phosphate dehydrogenase (NAD(P)+)
MNEPPLAIKVLVPEPPVEVATCEFPPLHRIAIIGAGSFGSALALLSSRGMNDVRLWAHSKEVAEGVKGEFENKIYLPGFHLFTRIEATNELAVALENTDIVVLAVPSHVCRDVLQQMRPNLKPEMTLVSATKGLEIETGMRVEEIVQDVFRGQTAPSYVALSGPSFARDVAKNDPCAVVAASRSPEAAARVQEALSLGRFRIYTNDDVTGVEIGGAVKNVMAIAAGVTAGLGLGASSAAALITRGIAEMTRLAVAMGGRAETLAGLSGLGDLMLTCFGELSRNRRVGVELGQGRKLPDILREMREVAEGVKTARATHGLAAKYNAETPIATGVYQLLYENKTPQGLMSELMDRPLRRE